MGPNGSLFVLTGAYSSLCLLMGPYVSSWIPIGPDGSLLVLIGPYKSLCVFRGPYGSL